MFPVLGNNPVASRAQRRGETDLEISNVQESDFGEFTCKVDSTPYKHTLVIVSAPDPKPTTPAIKKNPDSPNSSNGKNSTGGASDWTWGAPLLGLSWWIWVAIGAAGLVVIILMVVVVVVYKRTKRRKKRFMRMKKAQLSQMPKKYCQCARQTAAAKPHQGRRREKPSALPLQPLLQE
ncbi:uncharacterized protein V3H82_013067 isoform 2-T3 [Fundulus diaphanus]